MIVVVKNTQTVETITPSFVFYLSHINNNYTTTPFIRIITPFYNFIYHS
jgi:hypothetical protein